MFEFMIKKDPMMNSTFMMWLLISQFDTACETLKVKLLDSRAFKETVLSDYI
jgi:hypothetical protein